MRRLVLIPVLAVALAAGACGGGGGGGSSSAYCKALRDTAKQAAADAKKTTSTTAGIAATRQRVNDAFAKLSKNAPSSLKGDYKTVQDYYSAYLDSLANPSGADRTKLTQLAPKAQAAGAHISDYNKKVCKFTGGTTSGNSATTKP